jgi:hypothetical protein
MIPAVLVVILGLAALVFVLRPLRRGPVRDEAETPQLIQEAEERKDSALLAIIDIEEERSVGKLSDADFDSLRSQYEIEALRALRELDELGAESGSADDAIEAEIARIRSRLDEPPANGT